MNDDRSVLKRGVAYPLGDNLTLDECRRFGVRSPGGLLTEGANWNTIQAVWDGLPRRAPKKGEWYLSGAPIDAYRAPNDLTMEFHIARLVRVETKTVQVITEIDEKGGDDQ
jgi:hypothetical protein